MKTISIRVALTLICLWFLPFHAAGKELTPVGQVVGLELRDGSVVVASFDEELGRTRGYRSAMRSAKSTAWRSALLRMSAKRWNSPMAQ